MLVTLLIKCEISEPQYEIRNYYKKLLIIASMERTRRYMADFITVNYNQLTIAVGE